MQFSTSKPLGKTEPYLALTALLESIADDYPRLPFRGSLHHRISKNACFIRGMDSADIALLRDNQRQNSWLGLSKTLSNVKSPALRDILPETEKEFKWIFKNSSPLKP